MSSCSSWHSSANCQLKIRKKHVELSSDSGRWNNYQNVYVILQVIKFTFLDLDIEPNFYDSIRLLDGNQFGSWIAQLSGSSFSTPTYRSTHGVMSVEFHSDSSIVYRGFSASYLSERGYEVFDNIRYPCISHSSVIHTCRCCCHT